MSDVRSDDVKDETDSLAQKAVLALSQLSSQLGSLLGTLRGMIVRLRRAERDRMEAFDILNMMYVGWPGPRSGELYNELTAFMARHQGYGTQLNEYVQGADYGRDDVEEDEEEESWDPTDHLVGDTIFDDDEEEPEEPGEDGHQT